MVFCFPPPIMAGHIAPHMAECKAHAVALLPVMNAHWFPLLQLATVRSQWPSANGGIRNWWYPRWRMIAYEVDLRNLDSNGLIIKYIYILIRACDRPPPPVSDHRKAARSHASARPLDIVVYSVV